MLGDEALAAPSIGGHLSAEYSTNWPEAGCPINGTDVTQLGNTREHPAKRE
jgi:hypothetical protein